MGNDERILTPSDLILPARRNMKNYYGLAVSALVLCVAALSGCAGATRLPTRAKGPAGDALQNIQLDLTFLDTPGTQRAEVVSRLSSVGMYSNTRLFWGRWSESKWGYWWVIAGMNGAGAGDAKRIWHIRNLLVSFGENGIVRKKALFGEDKALWAELHSQLVDSSPLEISQPIQIQVIGGTKVQMITLGKDSIQFDRQNALLPVQIPPQRIVRISHPSPQAVFRISRNSADSLADPALTCHTLHLAEKGPLGKRISFCASPGNAVTTFQYFQQYGSPQLRWD